MSDRRYKRLESEWKATGDIYLHAQLISMCIRNETLNRDNVLFCAYWGHEAAKLVCSDEVKHDAIILRSKRISNSELRDIINGLNNFEPVLTRRVAIACADLCVNFLIKEENRNNDTSLLRMSPLLHSISESIEYAKAFVDDKTNSNELWEKIRACANILYPHNSRYSYYRITRNIRDKIEACHRISHNTSMDIVMNSPALLIPKATVAWFTDNEIYEAVRKFIYPWCLGGLE